MGRAVKFQKPDLTEIVDRAHADWKWTATQRAEGELWYPRFLELVYDNPGGAYYLISEPADQLWHTHITYTVRYRAYCEAILGFYLEHTPIANGSPWSAAVLKAAKGAYTKKGWPIGKIKNLMQVPCH